MNRKILWSNIIFVFGVLLATAVNASEFSGEYRGVISNVPMHMVLDQQGASLSGSMLGNNGDAYQVSGTVNGNVATGSMVYANDNSVWNFVLNLRDDGVVWSLAVLGMPVTNSSVLFVRAAASPSGSTASNRESGTVNQVSGNIDSRLIGSWRNTNSYVSGDFSAVSEKYVQFFTDGTFAYSNGRVVGGGDSGSFDSGGGSNVTRGNWQTQDSTLYYLVSGSNNWEAYGHYGFTSDGSTMRFVTGNGNKELWDRSR